MFFRSQCERIHVDTGIRCARVVLEGLNLVKVGTLALREAILAVELELGSDNRVLTPAVHVKSSLSKDERTSIRYIRAETSTAVICAVNKGLVVEAVGGGPDLRAGISGGVISSTGHLKETRGVDKAVRTSGSIHTTKGVDSVGKSINRISIVEGLGAKGLVKKSTTLKRRAVINVSIRLDNPDELLTGVVEVELDLVGGRTNRLITSELELLNQVLVRVLGHLAALISIKEDIVNIERRRNKRLLISSSRGLGARGSGEGLDGPQALLKGLNVKVDLDLVVLKGQEGKSKTGVAAKPELKRDVKSGLRKGIARSTNLGGTVGGRAGAVDRGKKRISDVGELGGLTDHLEVAALLLAGHSELVPDVHPVTILAVNALTTNLNLNLSNELLTDVVKPTSINTIIARLLHVLINLRKSNLEVGAVCKITVAGNRAGNAAAKISLTVESLLNRLHREVGVSAIRHLPEGNLGCSSKVNILGAVGHELHKSACHFWFIFYSKKK
jgi:hypothetical protein